MALTDTTIRNFKLAAGKRETLLADHNGLYLRVRVGTSGKATRTWQHRRKTDGAVRATQLGTYPEMTLKAARLEAAKLAEQRATDDSPIVAEAAKQWMREVVEKTRKDHERVQWYVDLILADVGSKRVSEIRAKDVADMARDCRDRAAKDAQAKAGGREAGRRMLQVLKLLLGYATANGWIEASPAAAITPKMLGAASKPRARVLTDDEIKWVIGCDMPQGPAWRFLLCTGLRLGEIYAGHRAGEYWIVPAEASKNGKQHRVWLSPLALAQLGDAWAPQWRVQNALSQMGKGWSCHDLRRTFSTRMNESPEKGGMGVAPFIVEKMLNHSLGGVMGVYNHAEYLPERKEALERWSDWLLALISDPPSADVVPLRSAAA